MSSHRFFVSQTLDTSEEPEIITLDQATAHHVNVLRIKPGERVVLVDSSEESFEAGFSSSNATTMEVSWLRHLEHYKMPSITLFQGISKGDRMDLVFRACTELGLESIVPVLTSRCIVRLQGEKAHSKGERWRRIAMSAAEQAGRDAPPIIPDPMPLNEAIEQAHDMDILICPYEEAKDGSIRDVMSGFDSKAQVGVFIGPEGGFEPEEIDALIDSDARIVTLGPTILRTETAGIVASTLVLSELGGLGMSR